MYSVEITCFALFRNGHFHNVVLTFTNVVHVNVENDNVVSTLSKVVYIKVEIHNNDSTLFDIVNSNGEIHNVVSTLIWRCPTSRRRINQKATLKQRWKLCWLWIQNSLTYNIFFCCPIFIQMVVHNSLQYLQKSRKDWYGPVITNISCISSFK